MVAFPNFAKEQKINNGVKAGQVPTKSLLSPQNLRQKGGYESSQPDMDKQRHVLL
jgi:hypothetical protein